MEITRTPVTAEIAAQRVARLRESMAAEGLEVVVLYSAPLGVGLNTVTTGNVRYLSGWADPEYASVLVLPLQGDAVLFVGGADMHRGLAEERINWPDDIRVGGGGAKYGVRVAAAIKDVVSSRPSVGTIGLHEMSADAYLAFADELGSIVATPCDVILDRQRVVKDRGEIELHRKASQISDSLIQSAMYSAAAPHKHGGQVLADMTWAGRCLEGDHVEGWISFGEKPSRPGATPWQAPGSIEPGHRLNIGTHVTYEGYWGHAIRMAFKGKASRELLDYGQAILEVQEAGLREMVPGRQLAEVVKAMNATIDKYAPLSREDDALRSRPGHGLGLQYSEPLLSDIFVAKNPDEHDVVIEEGMVFELHPNFGVPHLGLIVKGDTVVAGPNGGEFLTGIDAPVTEI